MKQVAAGSLKEKHSALTMRISMEEEYVRRNSARY